MKPPASSEPLTVSALARRIEGAFANAFPDTLRVVGEVTGPALRTHWYFGLKDAGAAISCVLFASSARKAGVEPVAGKQVVCTGRVEFYAPSGRVSLIVEKLEPVGEGPREAALRKLIEEVRALGWLDPARKRRLPAFPRRVAVVTSAGGAALQDVLVTMRRRCPAVEVLVADVRVQGDRAAGEVVRAIQYLGRHAQPLGLDAIIVTRGGGSIDDLWAFNERIVAQAIVECPLPVVAAIGHEVDTTLAELVADERCATPTQAAMRLTPDRAALARELDSLLGRGRSGLARELKAAGRRLEQVQAAAARTTASRLALQRRHLAALLARLMRRHPAAVHARTGIRLGAAWAALHRAAQSRVSRCELDPVLARLRRAGGLVVERARHELTSHLRELEAVSPWRVLDRGYSVTLKADGRAVRKPSDVRAGEVLTTRLSEGSITSSVSGTDRRPLKGRPRSDDPAQPGLFGAGGPGV